MNASAPAGRVTACGTSRRAAAMAVTAASGHAALGDQIVWTQQAALWIGHEATALLAVLAAFFGGSALGALWLGGRIGRSRHAVRWYAGCEVLIGAWALVLVAQLPGFSAWLVGLTGPAPTPERQWMVAFGGCFALLLPATVAMGATLPAMERLLEAWAADSAARAGAAPGRSIAALYASNTAGAVLGVLTTAFWLVPTLGANRTLMVCAALNLLCAAGAVRLLPAPAAARPGPRAADEPGRGLDGGGLLLQLACTGLLGVGYEVLVVRVLSQVAEDTVYTYALLLAVYLVGSALGAAAHARWRRQGAASAASTHALLCALAMACLLGTAALGAAEWLQAALARGPLSLHGMAGALGGEAVLALAAFGLPTVAMGALFSDLAIRARAQGVDFGRALGVNTLGAAAAPALFGVWVTPAVGAKWALLAIALGYLALAARPAVVTDAAPAGRRTAAAPTPSVPWSGARRPAWLLPAGLALALAVAVVAPPLVFVDLPTGAHLVRYTEGVDAAVSVVEDADGVRRLRINNRQQEGSSATRLVDGRQALLPILLHPAPRRALFLGLGTGVTAATATQDPALTVDAVELLPEVLAASADFGSAAPAAGPGARLHPIAADARRYVRATGVRYDVVVADNFHPARSGSGALYTVEHFRAVRRVLTDGGVFCQWLPLHQLDLGTLRSIVRSFLAAYPDGTAMLASNSLDTPVLGLVGRRGPTRFSEDAAQRRIARADWPTPLAAHGLDDATDLLGSLLAGPSALARFAGDAALNTDDHPVVAYAAPRITYAPDTLPRERLRQLLQVLAVQPDEVLAPGTGARDAARLAAYWTARRQFILAGMDVHPSGDVRDMLAQVRGPLLAVLRTSAAFRPAYDPLLRMAAALAPSDPRAAAELLAELVRLCPGRREAADALAAMGQSGDTAAVTAATTTVTTTAADRAASPAAGP